jgi:predicted O-methyltransferase YrrM
VTVTGSAPYDTIPGWSHPGEFEALASYASRCPGPWVEIGSYCGRSAVALGNEARKAGTVLFAVDPHRGNPEMAVGQECHHPEVWAEPHGSLSVLLDTIAHYDLEGIVIPVVGKGEDFALTGIRPGLVFIDGDHMYAGVRRDFETWSRLLAEGGIIALHDADTQAPMAVRDEAIADGWNHVEQVCSLAVLSR